MRRLNLLLLTFVLAVSFVHVNAFAEENTPDIKAPDKSFEESATADEAEGFSNYTVEFTYNDREYVLGGGKSAKLADILSAVGIEGVPTAASVSDESLFSASDATGEWVLTSHKAFDTEEWLKVVVSGVEYRITVTDAQGPITDESGNTYDTLKAAFDTVQDGDERTFTVNGSGVKVNGTNGNVTLRKAAKVTILAGSSDASLNGHIQVYGNNSKLVLGSGSDENKLTINGQISIGSGDLEINSDISAVCSGSNSGLKTLYLGYYSSTGPANVRINGGSFYSQGMSACHVEGSKVNVEHIKNATFESASSSDGTMAVCQGAKVALIKDCEVRDSSSYGLLVTQNSTIEEISGGSFTGKRAGIRLRNAGSAETGPRIETISGATLKSTQAITDPGTSSGAVVLEGYETGAAKVSIGTIKNCTITGGGANNYAGAITVINSYTGTPPTIDSISGNTIRCASGASGIVLQYAGIGALSGNDVLVTGGNGSAIIMGVMNSGKQNNNTIGSISGGSYKSTVSQGMYVVNSDNDHVVVGSISGAAFEGLTYGMNVNAGSIGDISNSVFTQTGDVSSTYSAIYFGNSATKVGKLTNVTATGNRYSIYNRGTVDTVTSLTATAGSCGILNYYLASIKEIEGGTVTVTGGGYGIYNYNATIGDVTDLTVTSNGTYAIYNTAKAGIGTISGGKYSQTSESQAGNAAVYNQNSSIEALSEVELDGLNGIYISQNNANSPSTIPLIDSCTITAKRVGVQNQGGTIDEAKDNTITADQGIVNLSAIGTVSGGTITATRQGIVVQKNSASDLYVGTLDAVDGVTIESGTEGIKAHNGSTIGTLSGNTVNAGTDAVQIVPTATVGEITSGAYAGEKNGVNCAGTLGTITGDPAFYGKSGYAIDNTEEEAAIKVEPKLTTQLHGNARYLGALGQFADPEADTYPVFTPGSQIYAMSAGTLQDVKQMPNTAFHYLTTNVKVSYDGNGGKGSMSDKTYEGEWTNALKAEDNAFTRKGYTFTGWNTSADGKGKAYRPGDIIDINAPEITLYARWKENATPDPQADCRITYVLNGGEFNGSPDDIVETYRAGTRIKIHAAPVREGYTFLYWEGSEYQPGDSYTVQGDHTFTAQWQKNGSPGPDEPKSGQEKKSMPNLGDGNRLLLWLAIAAAAAPALAFLIRARRREN